MLLVNAIVNFEVLGYSILRRLLDVCVNWSISACLKTAFQKT